MSIYTSLQHPILDVTAKMRGRGDRPVRVGHDLVTKDVVVVLDEAHAERLASVLAQLDSNPDRDRDPAHLDAVLTVDKDDQDVWMHALVDVLSAVAMARNEPLNLVPTDATHRLRSV